MTPEVGAALGIAAAAVGGLAVGVERQWSGHASGPDARFAGVRTFALLGGLGGIAGWLLAIGAVAFGSVILGGAAALIVAAYLRGSRNSVDGTTEVAALVVIATGVLAGAGHLEIASGATAVTILILIEKSRLHGMVERLNDAELRAAARFAVMAVVVLPLLPEGPYGPYGGVRPRELWALVLVFTGLSFVGYIMRRVIGPGRGYAIAGLLGGMVSSTAVTLTFARASRGERDLAVPLAGGVVAASTVLFARMALGAALLSPELALAVVPLLAVPFAVGTAVSARGLWQSQVGTKAAIEAPDNPLEFWSAFQLGLLFQIVLYAVQFVRQWFGDAGIVWSGAVLGLTDVDALTISMAKTVAGGAPAVLCAKALALGALSNTLFKLGLAFALGRGSFRPLVAGGLALIAAAGAAAFVLV